MLFCEQKHVNICLIMLVVESFMAEWQRKLDEGTDTQFGTWDLFFRNTKNNNKETKSEQNRAKNRAVF